jgi:transmembrane sensor
MPYENYTLEDFLTDSEFKNWVLNPNENTKLFWGKWIDSHPEQAETILRAKELILSYRFKDAELISEEEQEVILENILRKQKPVKKRSEVYRLKYAAAILLLITSSIFILFLLPDKPAEKHIAMVIKENPAGQKSTLRLPDGTRVWLNSASRIKFPEEFIDERMVELKGEAYFEVVKDPEKAFKVVSNGIITTALGTSFNIRAYDEQKDVEVWLLSGKVSVESFNENLSQQEKILISTGEQVIYDTESQSLTKILPKNNGVLWKEGIISFTKAGFGEIKRELERWYGVKIEVQNLTRELSYTAEFDNESLERILERMAFTEKFSFKINKDTVKIIFD